MTRILARVALLALAVSISLSAFAGSKGEPLTLLHDTQLNGTVIPAGEYTVKYDANGSTCQVSVMKGNKTVATANGELKQLSYKPAHNQVVLDHSGSVPTINELDFSKTSTAIAFAPGEATASGK